MGLDGLQQCLWVRGTHLVVDVQTVGRATNGNHLGTEFVKHFGGHLVGCAMRAIDHKFDTLECQVIGESAFAKFNVPTSGIVQAASLAQTGGVSPDRRFIQCGFDIKLPSVRQLGPFGAEEFDAVVGKRIVTCTDHHTQRGALRAGQVGHARRWQGPQQHDIFNSAGVNVVLLGPIPTPAVAYLTRAQRANLGVVISASHNAFQDNGIKFFSAQGTKLDDAWELAVEAMMQESPIWVDSANLGKAKRLDDASGRYIEFCKSTFANDLTLKGLKIVVDAAHGAAYQVAPKVFHELGAEVVSIGCAPDGMNINKDVGATHPEALIEAVKLHKADYLSLIHISEPTRPY